ncbi:unnamed protein product [Ixodes persulcatus]
MHTGLYSVSRRLGELWRPRPPHDPIRASERGTDLVSRELFCRSPEEPAVV